MEGVTAQQSHESDTSAHDQDTSDFGVLTLDLSLKVEVQAAPDPLQSAPPERLESVRRSVRDIVAARRASTEFLPGD